MPVHHTPDPPGLVALGIIIFAAFAAWGFVRRVDPRSSFDATLARAHRIAAALTAIASLGWLAIEWHLEGGLRFGFGWHQNSCGLLAAGLLHGLCRATTGKPWFDVENPRNSIRLVLEPVTWLATLVFAVLPQL